jgi:hypothetical protein
MLLSAASGLEGLMVGNRDNPVIKDSTVAQISAFVYYQANVIAKLEKSKEFQNMFSKTIFQQIEKDFPAFIDSQARTRPRSFHHVYEWGKAGNAEARLFKLNKLTQEGLSFKLDYEFMPSVSNVPNKSSRRRYKFENKASVMEIGMPVIISPKAAERLVFKIDGETVFMPKGASVTVQRPGGSGVKNQFRLAYSRWFSSDLVNLSIKRSGFQRLFNSSMTKALALPMDIKKVKYSFSKNAIRAQADMALKQSFGGAL